MADLIKIKGGSGAVPTLQDRELGYSETEKALYIGTPNGNVRLCGEGDSPDVSEIVAKISSIEAEIASIRDEISQINARLNELTPSE